MSDGKVNHIGIATNSLDEAQKIWSALGFSTCNDDSVPEQGVKIRYLEGSGETRIELLEPLGDDTPVGRFIAKKGVGVQQIAVEVDHIESKIEELKGIGIRMVNDSPIIGSGGHRIAFVHPSSCGGVMIELVERI